MQVYTAAFVDRHREVRVFERRVQYLQYSRLCVRRCGVGEDVGRVLQWVYFSARIAVRFRPVARPPGPSGRACFIGGAHDARESRV